MFIITLFIIAKIWKQPNVHCQVIRLKNVVDTYNGIFFSFKKKEFLPCAATWMNPEDIMLSEMSQFQGKYTIPLI